MGLLPLAMGAQAYAGYKMLPQQDQNGIKQYAQGGLDGFGRYFGGGPPPPDYTQAAQKTADQNRPDQYNPWGSSTWSVGPDGRPVQTTSLNPAEQQALDAQQGMQAQRSQAAQGMFGSALGDLQKGIDWTALPKIDNGFAAQQQAQQAAYNNQMNTLNPQFQHQSQQMQSQLANQGLDPSGAAATSAQNQLGAQQNQAEQGAWNNSVAAGNVAQAQAFGQSMQARNQGLQEQLQQQYGGLNAMNALMQGQGVQMPQFAGFNPGANYLAAAALQNQGAQAQYQNQQQAWGQLANGLGGLGGGFMSFFA